MEELGDGQAAPPAPMEGFGDFVEDTVPAVEGGPANGTAADEELFSSAAPASAASASASAAPEVPAAPLAHDDPRVKWAAENQKVIAAREKAEAAKKVEVLKAAKEYLDKVNKARSVQLEARAKANREAEKVAGVAEGAVPRGTTPWERVISVCNFNAEALSKDPFKELSRYKAVLLAAKAANISVSS